MTSRAAYFEQVDSFPQPTTDNANSLVSLSLTNRTNALTHGLHRFPAKYIPQVPRWALEAYASPGTRILDPFAGSGTTNVEAAAHGYSSAALDVNPLSRLIVGAKSTSLPDEVLLHLAQAISVSWKPARGVLRSPIAGVNNFEHWFAEPTWRDLTGLKSAIISSTVEGPYRDFFLVVFSSIVRAVSNADDQSQKTYVSGTRQKNPPRVGPAWDNAVRRAVTGMEEFNRTLASNATVKTPFDGNALQIGFGDNTFDLAISSPPYLDSVDYPYNLMLEHFWLANELGIPSREAFNQLRHGQIGAKTPRALLALPAPVAELAEFSEIPEYRQAAVVSYFAFMDRHFSEMARVVTSDGRYVLVVGNSGTRNGPLPIHKALIQLAASHGLGLEHAFAYRLRRHYMKFPRAGRGGIILVDWVLTLKKGLKSELELPDLLDSHVEIDPLAVAH